MQDRKKKFAEESKKLKEEKKRKKESRKQVFTKFNSLRPKFTTKRTNEETIDQILQNIADDDDNAKKRSFII